MGGRWCKYACGSCPGVAGSAPSSGLSQSLQRSCATECLCPAPPPFPGRSLSAPHSGYRAVGLQRNQNAALKASYEECLASMQRGPASLATDHETGQAIKRLRRSHGLPASQPPFQLNEALLFHKSRAAYSTILETGLSSCYVREQGCVFGKGIYFADDLRKSAQYGGPSQQVLVCRVALGDCAAVSPHGRRSTPGGNVVASWDQISAPRKHDCVKR